MPVNTIPFGHKPPIPLDVIPFRCVAHGNTTLKATMGYVEVQHGQIVSINPDCGCRFVFGHNEHIQHHRNGG